MAQSPSPGDFTLDDAGYGTNCWLVNAPSAIAGAMLIVVEHPALIDVAIAFEGGTVIGLDTAKTYVLDQIGPGDERSTTVVPPGGVVTPETIDPTVLTPSATPTYLAIENYGDGISRIIHLNGGYAADTIVNLYDVTDVFVMAVQIDLPFVGLAEGSYYCKALEKDKSLSTRFPTASLVIVGGLSTTGTTPYASMAEATVYFGERLNSQVWYNSEPNEQLVALKTATRYINRLNFIGERTDTTSPMQFPRGGDTVVPDDIKAACCEIAYALLDGIDVEKESENLDMVSQGYGNVRSTYERSMKPAHILAGIPSIVAWRLLLPYLPDSRIISVTRV
jgi:hypothetical protein